MQFSHEYPEDNYHAPSRPTDRNPPGGSVYAPASSHAGPNPEYYYTEDGRPFFDHSRQRYIHPFIPRPPGAIDPQPEQRDYPDEDTIPRILAGPGRGYDPYPRGTGRGEQERRASRRGDRGDRGDRGSRRERERDDRDMDEDEIEEVVAATTTRTGGALVITTPEGYIGYWTRNEAGVPMFVSTPHLPPGTPVAAPGV